MYVRHLSRITRLGKLNHAMQDFFREWHEATKGRPATGCVNISEMPIIREMNQRLKDDLAGVKFYQRFAANVAQLQTLAVEIVRESGLKTSVPFAVSSSKLIRQDGFDRIFASTLPLTSATPDSAVSERAQAG